MRPSDKEDTWRPIIFLIGSISLDWQGMIPMESMSTLQAMLISRLVISSSGMTR